MIREYIAYTEIALLELLPTVCLGQAILLIFIDKCNFWSVWQSCLISSCHSKAFEKYRNRYQSIYQVEFVNGQLASWLLHV